MERLDAAESGGVEAVLSEADELIEKDETHVADAFASENRARLARNANPCGAAVGIALAALQAPEQADELSQQASELLQSENSTAAGAAAVAALGCIGPRAFEHKAVRLSEQLGQALAHAKSESNRTACAAAISVLVGSNRLHPAAAASIVDAAIVRTASRSKGWKARSESMRVLARAIRSSQRIARRVLAGAMEVIDAGLTDTHTKAADAAKEALSAALESAPNVEVRSLASSLGDAHRDPAGKSEDCLDDLLELAFVNAMDISSLSIVMPPVLRCLRSRSANVRNKACAVAGNAAALARARSHLQPYVESLAPALARLLEDPSPDVRKAASRALSSMLQSMDTGEHLSFFESVSACQDELNTSESQQARKNAQGQLQSWSNYALELLDARG